MKRILLATAFVALANLSYAAGPSGTAPTKLIAGSNVTLSPQSPCSRNCTINASTGSGTVTGQVCETWDSTLTVVANVFEFPIPWASYTVTGMKSATNGTGTPSFTVAAKIAGTNITGLSAVAVSGSTNTVTAASGANTGSANDQLTLVVSVPSGIPQQAYVCLVITHTVN